MIVLFKKKFSNAQQYINIYTTYIAFKCRNKKSGDVIN